VTRILRMSTATALLVAAVAVAAGKGAPPQGHAHSLQQEEPPDIKPLRGEPDGDRMDLTSNVHTVTAAELPALLRSLSAGAQHAILLRTTPSAVGFLVWLPAHFHTAAEPWPTVFFLHGGDQMKATCNGDDVASLGTVANHGLPYAIEERSPFNERFVLVSPQSLRGTCYTSPPNSATAEALRVALFASPSLDRNRAYLTGLSYGGNQVWEWAAFNPNHVQPWAAIAPCSSVWPRAPVRRWLSIPR
jgi:hypothetical protein